MVRRLVSFIVMDQISRAYWRRKNRELDAEVARMTSAFVAHCEALTEDAKDMVAVFQEWNV